MPPSLPSQPVSLTQLPDLSTTRFVPPTASAVGSVSGVDCWNRPCTLPQLLRPSSPVATGKVMPLAAPCSKICSDASANAFPRLPPSSSQPPQLELSASTRLSLTTWLYVSSASLSVNCGKLYR